MHIVRNFLIITMLMFVNTIYASEQHQLNNEFWEKLSKFQRTLYVIGVLEGMNYGSWDVWIDLSQEAKDHPPKGVKNDVIEKWAIEFSGKSLNKRMAKNVTNAQIVTGVTQMYKDYRNKQIPVVSIVDLVIQSIKGASKEEIENRLIEMRKEVTSDNFE